MSVYLHDIPLEQAQAVFADALKSADLFSILGKETLPLNEHALGRTLAEPVWAKLSAPHYHASAMDGFAVRAHETNGASLTAPLSLRYESQTQYVDTGDPLPDWANAVIQIENTESLNEDGSPSTDTRAPHSIRIREAVPPWKHVRPLGEDMVATQLVLPAGHTLRPVDLGAIAGCGHHEVVVTRRPKVAVLPTGTELKPIGEPVKSGDIIEYNSLVLAAQVRDWGAEATRFPITIDIFDDIQATVTQAAQAYDLILLNAGSSAGSEDFSASVIDSLGEVLVHGVAVRPGHPVILGMVESGKEKGQRPEAKGQSNGNDENQPPISNPQSPARSAESPNRLIPIIGVPGYPVSAAMTGEIFIKPLLETWLGKQPEPAPIMKATLTRKLASPSGDDDYVRMAVGRVGERVLAAPLSRGAGVISSLVRADGIAVVPSGSQGLPAGAEVNIQLMRSPQEIERTIFAMGSHDMTLDLLAQFLSTHERRLASANVGSLGGLVALRRGEAHLAGSHLLDPDTGVYNESYIAQYLPNVPVQRVHLVGREQGLIVKNGNPKAIKSLADLERVQFVNRQTGAGTRVLLDYQLGLGNIEADVISGYEQEEYTHLAVASAVASGRADCGLGIAAAAKALELEFVPLFQEQYELIIPQIYFEDALLQPLLALLNDREFQQGVAALPGYDVANMGMLVG